MFNRFKTQTKAGVHLFCFLFDRSHVSFFHLRHLCFMICIMQFSLVCERKGFRAHMNMAYFAGGLVLTPITGYLCDRCVFQSANQS